MAEIREYKTKQRGLILELLRSQQNHCFLIEEIYRNLTDNGQKIGKTTVYRTLSKLCDEGKVMRYASPHGEGAFFQYLEHHQQDTEHIHLKCINCGKVDHIDCTFVGRLNDHLLGEHQFLIDKQQTTLFGYCKNCRNHK